MTTLIQFKDIFKRYGSNLVLNNLNFGINEGDIFGIIGLSGSGKTTILNTLIGFIRANSGQIIYKDQDISKNKKRIEQIAGFATQSCSFYQKLTVEENLHYFGKLYNMKREDIVKRIDELLPLVELQPTKKVLAKNLSTGMQRRLDIACAMIHHPQILILDEPTEDLDPVLRREILRLIRKINIEEGTTIIITSHLLNEIESICSRIAILHKGKMIRSGTPAELKDMYTKNQEIHLRTYPGKYDQIITHLKRTGGITDATSQGNKIVIYTKDAEKVLHDILETLAVNKEKLIDIDVNRPSLEEVFAFFTKEK
ncbi:MAG: ABC transporter ATP-binding protein [Candidatus Nanoarchaeia archaeon]|nr:ABC transporter ATP-binding protein [Candidatus Nanoarchaeia archaeon]